MLDAHAPHGFNAVFAEARLSSPREALHMACQELISRAGYLAPGTYSIHAADGHDDLWNPSQPGTPVVALEQLYDPVLATFGLAMSKIASRDTDAAHFARVDQTIVALRLGLLAKALDQAFLHLEHREAFGQKLLHHQLIKARFAQSGALITRLLEELRLVSGHNLPCDTTRMQDAISHHFSQCSKLMGGHGYLAGSINSLEYLSNLIRAALVCPKIGPNT